MNEIKKTENQEIISAAATLKASVQLFLESKDLRHLNWTLEDCARLIDAVNDMKKEQQA